MCGRHGSMSDTDRRMRDLLDAERLESRARADDIDDRIERANFVKFDLGGVDAMN